MSVAQYRPNMLYEFQDNRFIDSLLCILKKRPLRIHWARIQTCHHIFTKIELLLPTDSSNMHYEFQEDSLTSARGVFFPTILLSSPPFIRLLLFTHTPSIKVTDWISLLTLFSPYMPHPSRPIPHYFVFKKIDQSGSIDLESKRHHIFTKIEWLLLIDSSNMYYKFQEDAPTSARVT